MGSKQQSLVPESTMACCLLMFKNMERPPNWKEKLIPYINVRISLIYTKFMVVVTTEWDWEVRKISDGGKRKLA